MQPPDYTKKGEASVLGDLFGTYMPGVDPETGVCIRDGRFTRWRPKVPDSFPEDLAYLNQSCIVRSFNVGFSGVSRNLSFPTEAEVAERIAQMRNYAVIDKNGMASRAGFVTFMDTTFHGAGHVWIGGHMAWPLSPNDPLFYLHHAQMDRIWSLWQDCHDHDKIDVRDGKIRNQNYFFYGPVRTSRGYGVNDGPLDPMMFTFDNHTRAQRFYQLLPKAEQRRELNAMDSMRIMDNQRIPSMVYAYDPNDNVKAVLDRTGVRCNWNWFATPNAVIKERISHAVVDTDGEPSKDGLQSNSVKIGAVVGISVGGIVLVAVLSIIAYSLWLKQQPVEEKV